MRMLMIVSLPHQEFNAALRDGSAGQKIGRILDDANADAVYFTELNGQRGVVLAIELEDSVQVPKFAEPWFLEFNADVEFRIAMTPEDLGRAGLEELGKKWG